MTEYVEKEYVSRLKSGDKSAFKALFEHYYPVFFTFAKNMLNDEFIADDIIQNVFMRVWIRRENLDTSRSFKNYLLVSVRNEIYVHYRSLFLKKEEALDNDYVNSSSLEDDVSATDLKERIGGIISRMPQRRREVFTLSRVNGMTNAEIASRLGISVRTVEKHIELALRDIRKILLIPVLLLVFLVW